MAELKFRSDIFKSFKKSNFLEVFFRFFFTIFFKYIKMSKNSSAKYCQKYKEKLQKKACERDQNLSEEEIQKKQLYGHECYKSLSED